jgi:FlaA1/EpsC-like NDP-sugar epimerase
MNDVDIVVHAAALKQVPISEYNPIEAIRTNIYGAINVIDAAIDNRVEKVITISSDKAVYPINLYGATKLVAEKLFVQSNIYAGKHGTKFSVVRYGNVIGSRGSVIPLFLEQKKTAKITITDERMTRFWITLEQGVRFVIDCINRAKGGEIFVPKLPSLRIIDVADTIAPEAKKEIIGVRPGEKIHEVLLTDEEAKHTKEFDAYFVIEPEHPFWTENDMTLEGGRPLAEGFRYTSGDNSRWLSKEDLKKMLSELEREE